jgi:divalent metal cation (Fe/Co/Zn/Cd) transporter
VTPRDVLRDLLTTVIELLGLAAIVWGVYLYDPRAALIVGGLLAVLLGYILAAPPAKGPDR